MDTGKPVVRNLSLKELIPDRQNTGKHHDTVRNLSLKELILTTDIPIIYIQSG